MAAIDWALRTAAPDEAVLARARASAERCLAGLRASPWPDIAWRTSGLSSGFPMEVSCSWTRALVRYTTEVAGPEIDPRARLPIASALVESLGGAAVPAELGAAAARMQAGGALEYGAWIGARHDAGGDRYKLYIEAPPTDAARALAGVLGGKPPAPSARAVLFGCEPAAGRVEVYYRTFGLGAGGLGALVRPLGLDGRAAELVALTGELHRRDARDAIAAGEVGVSVSAAGGEADRVTLFWRARHLFRGDADARRRLLALGRRLGARLDAYQALTFALDGTSSTEAHGLVALTVARGGGPIDVTIDLCPSILYRARG